MNLYPPLHTDQFVPMFISFMSEELHTSYSQVENLHPGIGARRANGRESIRLAGWF